MIRQQNRFDLETKPDPYRYGLSPSHFIPTFGVTARSAPRPCASTGPRPLTSPNSWRWCPRSLPHPPWTTWSIQRPPSSFKKATWATTTKSDRVSKPVWSRHGHYCNFSPYFPARYLRSCLFITVMRARLKVPAKNSPALLFLSRGKAADFFFFLLLFPFWGRTEQGNSLQQLSNALKWR